MNGSEKFQKNLTLMLFILTNIISIVGRVIFFIKKK